MAASWNFPTPFRVQLRAMKGSLTSLVFRLFLAVPFVFSAALLPSQQAPDLSHPTDYVTDDAHVLSAEAIAGIDSLCGQLDHSKANAQIAVVTVDTIDGDDVASYATSLYSKMKIGKKGSDRGILIFLAVKDHKRQIVTGYGLEGILPDAKVGDIGRAMVPDLRANDFDGAVTLAVGQIAQVIAADANVTLTNAPVMAQRPVRQRHPASAGQILLVIILIIFFGGFFIVRLLASFGLLFGGWGGGPWMGGGGGGGWGGGGGGGFGGGGDSGGGFGGFGGGDTGGGGAGGSW